MNETILNNDKTIVILNKLVQNGFYHGIITPTRIEYERKRNLSFLKGDNSRIVGILNNENRYELNFVYKPYMNVLLKLGIVLGIILTTISFLKGNWFLPIFFFVIPFLIMFIRFKLRKKKEIERFSSKFLELYKLEYEFN